MSLRSSTFVNSAYRMPITAEPPMVRGGFDGLNGPRKKRNMANRDDAQELEIAGSHELSNANHNEIQHQVVNGSGERRHTLLDRAGSRPSKVTQQKNTSAQLATGSEVVPQGESAMQRHQLSTSNKNWPYSEPEGLDDCKPTWDHDDIVSRVNRKTDPRRPSQPVYGRSSTATAAGKRFETYASGEDSATSVASDASDSSSHASESDSQSEESDSGSDTDSDGESSARSDWFDNEAKTSIARQSKSHLHWHRNEQCIFAHSPIMCLQKQRVKPSSTSNHTCLMRWLCLNPRVSKHLTRIETC